MPIVRTQEFYGAQVNPSRLLDENDLVELAQQPVYLVSRNLVVTDEIRKKIAFIISGNMAGSLNFDRPDNIVRIAKNGYMYLKNGGITAWVPKIYVSLKPEKEPFKGCVPVSKIILRDNWEDFLDLSVALAELSGS